MIIGGLAVLSFLAHEKERSRKNSKVVSGPIPPIIPTVFIMLLFHQIFHWNVQCLSNLGDRLHAWFNNHITLNFGKGSVLYTGLSHQIICGRGEFRSPYKFWAEGTGFEPASPCGHRFSKPAH